MTSDTFRIVSPLELAAWAVTFAGVMGILSQRAAARRAGRPVTRWAVALSVAVTIIGIALGIFGVATGTVSLF